MITQWTDTFSDQCM